MSTQHIADIRIEDFDYPLPESRIASHPAAVRDECLLLYKNSARPEPSTHVFTELSALLPADAVLIANDTRVINARLQFRKGAAADGARIEIFCLEPHSPADYACNFAATGECEWTCFVGNSKRWKSGDLAQTLTVDGRQVTLRASRVSCDGASSVVRFSWDDPATTFSSIISAAGEIPIPPYLNRGTEQADTTDYQTVYSAVNGSVAAPTAGLHFTERVLAGLGARGIAMRHLTLHVGAGTFQPVKSDTIGEHAMHSEFISVKRSLIELLAARPKVVAVGTTSVRTLESLYHLGCRLSQGLPVDELPQWYPYDPTHPHLTVPEAMSALLRHMDCLGTDTFISATRLMIAPGYRFRVVDGLVTNFHQPRSTLLLLVSAFLMCKGETPDAWRAIYDHALSDPRYRFLSYGDACLFL